MSHSEMSSVDKTTPSASPAPPSASQRVMRYLQTGIDSKKCNAISIYACFLTGFTSCMSFSACYIWCGFQTGNVAQLGLALARTFDPHPERTYGFQKADQQALTSLLSFLVGTSLGRVGDRIGAKNRSWLVLAAFTQCLLAMAAALAIHYSGDSPFGLYRGEPSWGSALGMTALGFLSATLGLQGIVGKRVGSPMNTTVVLTTTWVEIFNDPLLLALKPAPSRDVRVGGVLALFFGAFFCRAIIGRIQDAGAIGVLCGLRFLQVIWWALIPAVQK